MNGRHPHVHIARGAAGLAAAMGIGRFVYTPILPLMTAQTGLSPTAASVLATANYVGYLLGALAGVVAPRALRTTPAWRAALVGVVATLAAMAWAHDVPTWAVLRLVAGFVSAAVFVIAVDWMLDHARGRSAQLPGWGFGGVGVGIAVSGALVLGVSAAGWRIAWWAAAGVAACAAAVAWHLRGAPEVAASVEPVAEGRSRPWFAVLLVCYTLEGVGYVIAGTFLVAAIAQTAPGHLGAGAWILVGVAAAPSAVLWAWAATRWSAPVLLTVALGVQAVGVALPAVAPGAAAALVGAVAFGGTFIGVSTLAVAAGRQLGFPKAVAVLTVGYSLGQIAGPLIVAPLLSHGFRQALLASGGIVAVAAAAAVVLLGCAELRRSGVGAGPRRATTRPDPTAASGPRRP